MTLQDLPGLPVSLLLHGSCALAALLLGTWQLLSAKGTTLHRVLGYIWSAIMMTVALSSFWIRLINPSGGLSLIHLLSAYVALSLPFAILAARRGQIVRHRRAMTGMYAGGLVLAGLLTLAPGRVLGRLLIGW